MLDAKYDFPSLRELRIFPTRTRRVPFPYPWPFKCCPQFRKIRISMKHSDILIDWNTIEELDITVNIVESFPISIRPHERLQSAISSSKIAGIAIYTGWTTILSPFLVLRPYPFASGNTTPTVMYSPRWVISRLPLPALKDLNTIEVGENINVPWITKFIRFILRSSWKVEARYLGLFRRGGFWNADPRNAIPPSYTGSPFTRPPTWMQAVTQIFHAHGPV